MKTYTPRNTEIFHLSASDFLTAPCDSWQVDFLNNYRTHPDRGDNPCSDEQAAEALAGYYWWTCCPGCMPDSEASGPFETEEEANEDAGGGEYEDYIIALAEELGEDPAGITEESHECYGMIVLSSGNAEYAIGTDEEAQEACVEYVKESIRSFKASFILSECDLPAQLEEGIRAMQEKRCESCNDTLLELVEKCTTLESFTDSAISADGRGHFLASYDGSEMDLADGYVAFRIN